MSDRYVQVDAKILRTIDELREQVGSCTLGQLANRCRMSKDAVRHRCQVLKNAGRVTWEPNIPGTLRRVEGREERLYSMLLIKAIEERAHNDTGELGVWAVAVVGMATAAAWPELVPEAEGDGSGEATDAADPGAGTGAGDEPADGGGNPPPANYCEPCDRTFKTPLALSGHQRSKVHAAAVAAQR